MRQADVAAGHVVFPPGLPAIRHRLRTQAFASFGGWPLGLPKKLLEVASRSGVYSLHRYPYILFGLCRTQVR